VIFSSGGEMPGSGIMTGRDSGALKIRINLKTIVCNKSRISIPEDREIYNSMTKWDQNRKE
jgi:hypothetical protein